MYSPGSFDNYVCPGPQYVGSLIVLRDLPGTVGG